MKFPQWKSLLRTSLFAAPLLFALPVLGAQISVGITIGPPPPARVVRVLPPTPGPEFVWIEGYWYPVGRHYRWHEGYWTRPPYPGARWVGLVTTDSDSSTVTGRENTAGLNMITAGTTTEAGTSVITTMAAIMIVTGNMIGVEIMTAKSTMIGNSPRSFQTI